jgi:serine/threonine protein kinase
MNDSYKPSEPYAEAPVAHTDALPIGARLSEFEILSLLGVGGFGMVYRAYDHSLHRTVAIKEYMPSALAGRSSGQAVSTRSTNDQSSLVTGLRSFVNEARLLAQFEHPSLVKVYRFWEANNTAYMVMPLYSGMTFRQVRAALQKPPTEAWLRTVLWSILGALKYLHENNIVHRDVSPDNIFLQDVGPPVLLDLGAARRAITDSTHKHTAILKVNYAPIEQYAGADDMRQGPWTDLYSVAAVMHGCLCNEAPLPATFRVLRDGMPTMESVTQTVQAHFGQSYSSEFVAAISHALAIQPQDRPQSVQEFCDEMDLTTPVNIQNFVWRESLGMLQSRVPSGTAPPVTQPGPALGLAPGAARQSPIDPDVTRIIMPKTAQSDLTIPGPLAYDRTSLTSDSMFPDFADPKPARAVAMDDTMVVSAPAPGPANVATGHVATPASSRKYGLMGAAAAAVFVLAGLTFWLGGKQTSPPVPPAPAVAVVVPPPVVKDVRATPEAEIINETLAVPAPAKAVSAAVAAVSAISAARAANPAKTASSASGQDGAASAPGPKKTASAPVGVPARVPAVEGTGSAAEKPARPVDNRPVPAQVQAQASAAAAAAAVPERRTPAEICASSNFFARPMCIYNECEKPEFTRLAMCVENRRRQQEGQQNNR